MGIMLNIIAGAIGENVVNSLEILWKGVLAIAVVLVIIYAVTKIMTVVSGRVADKKKAKEEKASEKERSEQ